MRQIKFRQKLKSQFVRNGEHFHYWGYIDGGFVAPVGKNQCDTDDEQFTGLQDKNGVDIYEGDIIEFTYWWFDGNHCESPLTGQIVYSDCLMSFQLKGVKNKDWERHTGYENDTEYFTPFSELNFEDADFNVIGNIHQNPELLE